MLCEYISCPCFVVSVSVCVCPHRIYWMEREDRKRCEYEMIQSVCDSSRQTNYTFNLFYFLLFVHSRWFDAFFLFGLKPKKKSHSNYIPCKIFFKGFCHSLFRSISLYHSLFIECIFVFCMCLTLIIPLAFVFRMVQYLNLKIGSNHIKQINKSNLQSSYYVFFFLVSSSSVRSLSQFYNLPRPFHSHPNIILQKSIRFECINGIDFNETKIKWILLLFN